MSSGFNGYGDLLAKLVSPLSDPDGTQEALAKLAQQQGAPPPMIARPQDDPRAMPQGAPAPTPRMPQQPSAAKLEEMGIPAQMGRPDIRRINEAAGRPDSAAMGIQRPSVIPAATPGATVPAVAPSSQGLPATPPTATNPGGVLNSAELGTRLRQWVDKQGTSADQAYGSIQQLAAQPLESEVLAPLEKQRQQAAVPLDPSDPQYQASKWQKLSRGLKAALRGLETGGVIGAAAGPILNANYDAPNDRYAHDFDQQQQKLSGLDQQIGEQRKSYEERTGRLKDLARDYGTTAGLYGSVSKNTIDEENSENQQARDEEIGRHNRADEQERTQRDTQEQANQQSQRRQEDRRIGIEGGRLQLERDKFNRENQAQGEDDPRRQPMIDEGTQKIQDLEDQWSYQPGENMYEDSKSGRQITPKQFTDMKNDISTKLDQSLSAKKLKPLNVRFNVDDAMGSQYRHAKPQSQQQSNFVTHKGSRVAVGDPVNVNGRSGKVTGFNQATGKAQVQWDDGQ